MAATRNPAAWAWAANKNGRLRLPAIRPMVSMLFLYTALGLLDERNQVGYLGVWAELLDLFESLLRVQLGPEEQAEGFVQELDALGAETGPLQAHQVQAEDGRHVARDDAERDHVLGNG